MPVNSNDLCGECHLEGRCRRLNSRAVTVDELTPIFIADVRAFMRSLDLPRDQWEPFLTDAYRDYPGAIVDATGNELELDTTVFDLPSLRYWFRDLLRPIPEGVQPRLRRSARQRFIVTASILRAVYPVPAMLWGKEIANDGARNLPKPVRITGCPYPHFRIG